MHANGFAAFKDKEEKIMSMVVQHNLTAMNSNRMLGITTSAQAKSSEKLSSGYRINRAADDAAGLTISEKMRKQIRGLDRASTNAEDGVSAVQTAEGALTEVHSMLQRMNELATQAANGTNSESDRDAIQAEIDQLTTEIDRVAETTKFNEIYLLKGDKAGATTTQTIAAHDAGIKGKLTDKGGGVSTFELDEPLENGDKVTIGGKEYTIGTSADHKDPTELNASKDGYEKLGTAPVDTATTLSAGDSVTYAGNTYTLTDKVALDDILNELKATGAKFKIGEVEVTVTNTAADTADKIIDGSGVTSNAGKVAAADVEKLIKYAKDNDLQLTVTAIKPNQVASNAASATAAADITGSFTVVDSLEKGEISSLLLKTQDAATLAKAGALKDGTVADADTVTLKAGDSVTIAGVTTTATEETPESAKKVYDNISKLNVGDTVKIGTGLEQKTYEIVEDADVDEEAGKLTKDAILAKIHDGDVVNDGTNTNTVIGDIALPESNEKVISAKQAYSMIADELQQASSIGTDVAATVTNDGDGKYTITQGTVEVKEALSFNLHVGSDADMTNKITVDIDAMDAAGLGVKNLNVSDDSGNSATYAIDAIADAISKVSAQRSALGAVQNRLEHTIANLDNVVENTTAAESRIRDTDMASEMVEYSKNNILAQAGQSMLAQANQSTQGVLSLLQ